jgi:uncharacterized membrane protein YdjX (TVP38/TMEM64 family)
MEWDRKKIAMASLFSFIMVMCVVIMYFVITDEEFLFTIIRNYFILPMLEIGFWAIFVFLFLMVVQSILAPIPSELVLLSGAMIFGFWGGAILGVIGSMISATITYFISKKGGRIILEAAGEKVGIVQRMILIMDEWIDKWGVWAIIIGRAVPVIMFDPISYASGISKIKTKPYLIATFIGSIPRAIFYAFLGTSLLGGRDPHYLKDMHPEEFEVVAKQFNLIFYIILAVLASMLIFANILSLQREKKKKQAQLVEVKATPKAPATEAAQGVPTSQRTDSPPDS